MRRLGLRESVTLASVAMLTFVLLFAGIAGNLLLSKRLAADADNALRNRAAAQLVTLDFKNGSLSVRESSSDALLDEQSWVFSDGRAIEKPRASVASQKAASSLATARTATYKTVDERVRLLAVPAPSADGKSQAGTVVVGLSLHPYERAERYARIGALALVLFVLLAGGLMVWWSVGRALRPVDEMTRRAAEWSEKDLHRRFALGDPFDEITNLADTLDGLLGRIDAALQREQRLTAEIAHELRTPLSGVRAEAELAMRSPGDDPTLALSAIIAGTDRLNSAIETLLAAHVGGSEEVRSCDPDKTVRALLAVSQSGAASKGITLSVERSIDGARVETDERVLVQALAPVIENAIRHASKQVRLEVTRADQSIVIRVLDDGPGVSDTMSELIFDPGASSTSGAGLGLPLARRLALSFGATMVAIPSENGGCFELRIPDAKSISAP